MSFALPPQREKIVSGALALATHLLFLALLVFGVSWQKTLPSAPVIADLWSSLPPVAAPKAAEPAPPPPPVEKTVAKAEPKAVPKPDIALKDKREQEKLAKEEKAKADARKREEEQLRLAALKTQQDAARAAKEQADAQRRLAEQQAAAQAKYVGEYVDRIKAKVRRFVVLPPNIQGNPEAEFDVVLLPGGEVLTAKLRKSSGNGAYDSAVERAILKAQPLPLPPDPQLFAQFRELQLKFRPQE